VTSGIGPEALRGTEAFMRAARNLQLPSNPRLIFERMAEFQESMRTSVQELAKQTFDGSAENVDVTATVTVYGAVTEIRIGTLAKRYTDNLTLGEAVVEAVRAARANAQNAWVERMTGTDLFGVSAGAFIPPPFS